jgi:hypothetical protein
MKKESTFERKFLTKLSQMGAYVPPKNDPLSVRGLADRVLCLGGKYVALEFKRSLKDYLKKSPRTALQAYTVEEVRRAGGYAAFVYPENQEQILTEIKEFIK